jgi:hypothetical protein
MMGRIHFPVSIVIFHFLLNGNGGRKDVRRPELSAAVQSGRCHVLTSYLCNVKMRQIASGNMNRVFNNDVTNKGVHSLVLVGRYPGRDRAVAQRLAQEFGRDEEWGLHVIISSPIVILEHLSLKQANAIHTVLADVQSAGGLFEIRYGIVDGTAILQWPEPPRLRGRLASEYGAAE